MIVQNEIDHLDIRAIPEIEGLNVVVNAKNGEQLVYVIHAYRMMSGNTFLSNLEVQNSKTNEVFTMSPIYNKIIDSYEVRVPNNVDTVNIIATPEANTTTVNGAGQKILRTGVNTFNIDTIAQDGSKDTYTVMIYRELSDNNYLSSLSTIDGTFVENFDKETLEYHLEIESSVNKLNLNYEKEVDTSKVQILNNSNFKAGKNIVTLRVTAENGDVRDYKIIANRKLSTNNYLKSLSTNEGTIEPEFNKETTEYKIVVENEVSLIDVKAEREDILSTMIGDRKYSLQVGENQKQLEKTHLY